MEVGLLTALKLVVLVLLYVFLARAVRTVLLDLYGPRKRKQEAPPPRPAVATTQTRRARRPPKELVVHATDGRPRVVELRGNAITIGRSERMNIPVDDVFASEEHAVLNVDGEGWSVRDLGSTNGTYLNGAKVTQATPISAGDQLRIGKTRIEVRR